jgi:membrane-bound lytic murein transglycosylase B
VLLAALSGFSCGAAAAEQDFARWLADLRLEARGQGISQATLDRALGSVKPIARVIELDRRQPEFTQTFWSYLDRAVSDQRVETGRRLLAKHAALLQDVERRYGVQPRFLVAIWGLESDYGNVTGGFPVIGALVTLAHDERRSDFFRAELLQSLRIIDQGHISAERMTGSWAGAMGQVQFMPTTFAAYAVDGDGDGRRDIWHSLPDAFASAANFLRALSWQGDKTWGREVRLPGDFDWELNGLGQSKTLEEWQALGVRRVGGGDLPQVEVSGSIVLPAGHTGPAFLVYQNYRSTLGWNRSHLYAIAVGHLADRIAGGGRFLSKRPANDRPLSRVEIKEIQSRLTALGFDPGPVDGVIGSGSRAALRAYQRSAKQPPDGYPTARLLDELRQAHQP